MKSLHLASLALVAPLLLSGCASAPSVELIEYQECLEAQHAFYLLKLEKNPYMSPDNFDRLESSWESNKTIAFDFAKEQCAKYRP